MLGYHNAMTLLVTETETACVNYIAYYCIRKTHQSAQSFFHILVVAISHNIRLKYYSQQT